MSLCTCIKVVVTTLSKKFSSKLGKPFARTPQMMKRINFPKNLFLLKMFVWTCTKKFWQAFRNFVAKKTKNFPELQNCWSYIFLNKFVFFIKNDSLATENAILTTVANNFLWESTQLQLRYWKPRKKTLKFRKENNVPKNVPMYMYKSSCDHLVKQILVKTLKTFCSSSANDEKNKLSQKPISPQIVRLNMYEEILASLP